VNNIRESIMNLKWNNTKMHSKM